MFNREKLLEMEQYTEAGEELDLVDLVDEKRIRCPIRDILEFDDEQDMLTELEKIEELEREEEEDENF
jgi:hypothetical protein